MEITEVFYPRNRQEWYDWLATHHQSKTEIWLQRYKKDTDLPSISYDDLVEVCLCFGWIDGVVKKNCPEGNVQRITPRRKKKTFLSELNRQRVWKLQGLGLMTPHGHAPTVRETFQAFPHFYQRLKVGWIVEPGKSRRAESQKRLNYLLKMTRQGKRYGSQPLLDWK